MFFNRSFLVVALIAVLALGLRLPGLGDFMTVDEENWMLRSAEFWDHILAGRLDATFMSTHPGSTVMWLVGAGETLQEVRLGFQVDKSNLLHFRKAATFPVVVVSSLLIGLCAWLVWRLGGSAIGIAAGVLLAVDPYLIGSTQIAHLDGLQALLMLASLLSFFVFLHEDRLRFAALAGVLFGLAMGVKLILALWLLPLFVLALVGAYGGRLKTQWPNVVRVLGFVGGISVLMFYVTWPTIWVKDDAARSFTRDIATVVTDEHVALSASENAIAPPTFYLRTVLGRVTPHVLLLSVGGVLLAGLCTWQLWRLRQRDVAGLGSDQHGYGIYLVWLVIYALGFLFFITLAAKKADRYALPALVVFPVLAAWVVGPAYRIIRRRGLVTPVVLNGAVLVVTIAAIVLPLLWSPYAIAYNSPLFSGVRPLSQQGWGEGLDAAARWLNEQPDAELTGVATWYPSVLQTYYKGSTLDLRYRDTHYVRYIVTYRNMYGRGPEELATEVLEELSDREPVHVVYINDEPVAWIYETGRQGYRMHHVGELVGGMEIGQTVIPEVDTWRGIAFTFATFSSRNNTEDVVVRIRESRNAPRDLRAVRVNARELVDNEWQEFLFEPITGTRGREFYVSISSPASFAGNAVTVRYIQGDVFPGGMVWQQAEGDVRDLPQYDVAYQIIGEEE